MSLRHVDWKELGDGRWWVLAEEASGLIVGYGVLQEPTTDYILRVPKQVIDKHRRPSGTLTDPGSQFCESEQRDNYVSQFEQYLADNGIKHLLCRVSHPQADGKLERFYGVYEQKRHQFKTIDEYAHWHNEIKPDLRLDIEALETTIQAFDGKLALERTEAIQSI